MVTSLPVPISLAPSLCTSSCMIRQACLVSVCIVLFKTSPHISLPVEAVDDMYNDPSVNPRNSGKYVPEGYSSRYEQGEEKARDDDEATLVGRPSSKENKISRKPSPQATEEMYEHA